MLLALPAPCQACRAAIAPFIRPAAEPRGGSSRPSAPPAYGRHQLPGLVKAVSFVF